MLQVDHIVRKTAHFTEYALLGAALLLLLRDYGRKHPQITAWLIATAYAGTDELHQLAAQAGRSAQLTDVGIDAAGALAGVLLAAMIAGKIHHSRS